MRYIMIAFLLLLSGCSTLKTTPEPPPPPTSQAQEVSRAQGMNLPKLGNISVSVRGSPDDAQRALAEKANQAGAAYYQILMVDETVMPGLWYATAILYGRLPAAGAQQ